MLNGLRVPGEYKASEVKGWDCFTQSKSGKWVPVRPFCYRGLSLGYRAKMAMKVFTGRADVLEWDK